MIQNNSPELIGLGPELDQLLGQHLKQRGTACSNLPQLTEDVASRIGIDSDLGRGFGEFVKTTYGKIRMDREEMAREVLETLVKVHRVTPGDMPSRSRNFVYLPLDREAPMSVQFARLVCNAQFMCDTFGQSMFTRGMTDEAYFRAPIKDGFSITVKGGSGSGAFALDLAIEADKFGDDRDRTRPSHELWRVGVDTTSTSKTHTDTTPDAMRIVRTGGAVKADDTWKKEQFQRFRRVMSTTPQRVLTFTAAHLMHGLNFNTGMALSTHGALSLSTLGRSTSEKPTRYSEQHEAAGFSDAHNPYWHIAKDLNTTFYERFVAKSPEDSGIQRHERDAVHLAICAFNLMVNVTDKPFPVKLCENNDKYSIECALGAFMN